MPSGVARLHRGADQGRAARPADADDAAQIVGRAHETDQGLGHGGDRLAAVAGTEHRIGAGRMVRGDGARVHVGAPAVAEGPDIDQPRRHAGRDDQVPDIGGLRALGVAGRDDIGAPAIRVRLLSLRSISMRESNLNSEVLGRWAVSSPPASCRNRPLQTGAGECANERHSCQLHCLTTPS